MKFAERFHHAIRAALASLCLLAGVAAHAAIVVDVTSSTASWNAIAYGSNNPDPSNDQQTGSGEGDIVGSLSHPSAYTAFGDAGTPSQTDGTLAFRVRLGADSNPVGFDGALFVGMDANNDGALDLFVGVNNSGSTAIIGIWSPGNGANISPSTTSIGNTPLVSYAETAANFHFAPVTLAMDPAVGASTDMNADGKNDYFLTFSVPFSEIVARLAARGIGGFEQTSHLNYVIATATQANSLNQDLNGIPKDFDPNGSWASLGGLSSSAPAGGSMPLPLPEPSAAMSLSLGLTLLAGLRRRGIGGTC